MREKAFFKSPHSNFDRSSTDRVPIEPGRNYPSEFFKNLIGRNWGLINRKKDSIDQAPIEHQSN